MIVPRWEWRTFGESFGAAEARLAASSATRVEDSDEVYIVSSRSEGSIKVRAGKLDVKRLEQVNEDGLEQWRPVAKAEFPIPATEIASLLSALDVAVPRLRRHDYGLDELMDEVVRPSADLLQVRVYKRRARYTLAGCMAELTDVRAGSRATRTIAVESEDPARVRAAVDELGLALLPNVSFPRGLKALVGFDTHRYAVVDVGTNSVKFHVGERGAHGRWLTIVDRAEITRLGEGLGETGELDSAAAERTIDAIATMADEASRNEAEAIAAVGTAGLRAASNATAFVDEVRMRCGLEVEIVSGDEEARLSYLAATSGLGLGQGSLAVFETGGGSSQFTFGRAGRIDERFSADVGAVRFTEAYSLGDAVDENVLAAALDAIAADFARLDGRPTPDELVAIGGAVTNLAAVKHELATYDSGVVQGTVLDRAEIDRQIELYRTRTVEERRRIVGLQPKRADIILAGACIVRTVLTKLGRESLTVSDRGLRHGLLVERFGQESPAAREMLGR
jgi:exopolyphosphatase / guanosine-5'-triphosphate,3'-diphosphate pyrophosphatase